MGFLVGVLAAGCGQGGVGNGGGRDDGIWVDTSGDRHVLFVTTEPLYEATLEYAAYRETLGYAVTVLTTQQVLDEAGPESLLTLAEALQSRTTAWASAILEGASRPETVQLYLMILGDAKDTTPEDPLFVPVVEGQGGFVGDVAYGDLDGDGAPEVAVGRLPVREAEEVRAYLERVQVYERQRTPGPWNKRVSAFAGAGGFGPELDGLMEWAALLVFESLSYDVDITMTYAASTSPYYLPRGAWDADYVQRYKDGSLLQPYIGHTSDWHDPGALSEPIRRGLVTYLSCGDGDFQSSWSPVSSLADEMLLTPAGPMVSLAASDWSHPYGNAVLALELSVALINDRAPSYGLALTWAKQRMLYPEGEVRGMLDTSSEAFLDEPANHLVRTHAVMYNLLGDPALDPGFPPGQVTFDGADSALLGERFTVTGTVSTDAAGRLMRDGEVTLTLEVERGEIPGDLIPVDGEPTLEQALANHATANEKVVVRATGPVQDGRFSVQLNIPATGLATGPYLLKGFALSDTTDAMGSVEFVLRRY